MGRIDPLVVCPEEDCGLENVGGEYKRLVLKQHFYRLYGTNEYVNIYMQHCPLRLVHTYIQRI